MVTCISYSTACRGCLSSLKIYQPCIECCTPLRAAPRQYSTIYKQERGSHRKMGKDASLRLGYNTGWTDIWLVSGTFQQLYQQELVRVCGVLSGFMLGMRLMDGFKRRWMKEAPNGRGLTQNMLGS